MDGLDTLKAKYLTAVAAAADESALEEVRVAALGKKGEISAQMSSLGKMDPDQRKVAGALLNALKDEIDAALRAKKAALGDVALNERLRTEWLDVTLPARPRRVGHDPPGQPGDGRTDRDLRRHRASPWPRVRRSNPTGTTSTR